MSEIQAPGIRILHILVPLTFGAYFRAVIVTESDSLELSYLMQMSLTVQSGESPWGCSHTALHLEKAYLKQELMENSNNCVKQDEERNNDMVIATAFFPCWYKYILYLPVHPLHNRSISSALFPVLCCFCDPTYPKGQLFKSQDHEVMVQ